MNMNKPDTTQSLETTSLQEVTKKEHSPTNKKYLLLIIVILILGVLLFWSRSQTQLSVLPSPPLDQTNQAVSNIQNSPRPYQTYAAPGYNFVWNEQTGETKLTAPDGNVITFTIDKKPLQVVLHETSQVLAIIVGNEGVPHMTQSLYVVKNGLAHHMYDAGSSPGNGDIIYRHQLYDDLEHKDSTWMNFSPSGDLLFAKRTVFEGIETVIIDIDALNLLHDGADDEHIHKGTLAYGRMFFSPSSSCWINVVPAGRRGQAVTIGNRERFVDTELPQEDESFYIPEVDTTEVLWGNDCSGVVFIKTVYQDNPLYLSISYPSKLVTQLAQNTLPQGLVNSASVDQVVVYSIYR